MRNRAFKQVDVFTSQAYLGNALAVVLDGEGLSDADMQRFACWTNLSETTFLLPPTEATADYRVRIFTPGGELPFAGHPTLGSCHAWLEAGGKSAAERATAIWQEALNHYAEPELDPAAAEALDAFVARRTKQGGAPLD